MLALQVWLQSCSLISTKVSDVESLCRDAKLLGEEVQCQFTCKFLQKERGAEYVSANRPSLQHAVPAQLEYWLTSIYPEYHSNMQKPSTHSLSWGPPVLPALTGPGQL